MDRRGHAFFPWALAALSIGLAGCRDGGGADAASPATPGAAASAAGAAGAVATPAEAVRYVIASTVQADAGGSAPGSRATRSTLYVVDPASPGSAPQTIELGTVSGPLTPPASAATTQDIRLDRTTRRRTYNGESVAFFAKDGKVWKIELRADLPHAPVQVSSVANACRIALDMGSLPVSADGRDAWLKVDTAGPGGNCALGATGAVFVRSTMPPAIAPLASLPGTYVDALHDGAGETLAFAMLTPAGLELYRPDFVGRIGKVDGGEGVRAAQWMGYDYTAPQASYYRVDGTLRRISWTASAATLASPTLTFTRPDFGTRNPVGHADLHDFYFGDDRKLMKVAGAGHPVEVATVTGQPIYAIWVSDTHLVMAQADPANPRAPIAASVVSKAGGKVVTVDKAHAVGTTATKMLYLSDNARHAIDFDGSHDTVLGDGPRPSAVVGNRSWVADLYYIDSYVTCVAGAAADRQCSNGRLVQTQIDSPARIDIGPVAHAGTYATANVGYGGHTMGVLLPATTGIPTFASYRASLQRGAGGSATDLYTWTPGVANSLARLTKDLP
jgi:hypothetical protein